MTDQQTETIEEEVPPVQLHVDEDEGYVPQEPTKKEVTAAKVVLTELKKRVKDYGDEQTVSALIAVVDVIDPFKTPEAWMAAEDDEYVGASVVTNIANYLLLGCRKLELDHKPLICLFRNKDKWMDGDRPRRGATAKVDQRMQYLLDGTKVVLEINFHHWLTLNPLQKVHTVYHELRGRAADGSSQAYDFHGYFDELEIFGTRSFHELVELGRSVSLAQEVEHPHQLVLFGEDEGHEA